jgi:hypothetical protein
MWYIVISLIGLGVVAAIAGYFRNKKLQKMLERGEISEIPEAQEIPEVCCGQHETCERDSLLAAVSKKIEYYNDEELDRFQGVEADAYDEPLRSLVKCFIPSGKWRWPVGSVACNCEGSICRMP